MQYINPASTWVHTYLCSRSICSAVKYFSLFLPTSRGIPPDKSWKIWLPELNMFWSTWGNSPNWEVDILKLYARLAVHQVRTTLLFLNLHVKLITHVRGDWVTPLLKEKTQMRSAWCRIYILFPRLENWIGNHIWEIYIPGLWLVSTYQ